MERSANWSLAVIHIPHIEALKALIIASRPPKAVIGKAVELISEVAGSKDGGGTIGRQLMSAVLPVSGPGSFAHHTDEVSMTVRGPTIVVANRAIGGAIFGDMRFEQAGPDPQPILYPPQPRNQLCKCGSGKKYKKCHGASR